jgi:class 3 adenylate cyclase
MPEHPRLRRLAELFEQAPYVAQILDPKWRVVYVSSEARAIAGLDPGADFDLGLSLFAREFRREESWGTTEENRLRFWRDIAPIIRHDVPPDDPAFDEIFDRSAEAARQLEPVEPPDIIASEIDFRPAAVPWIRRAWSGRWHSLYVRIKDESGELVGTVLLVRPYVSDTLAARLASGDLEMFERMAEMREPARRSCAVLFVDLARSGEISKQLSSRAYFELIRSLTDVIDAEVGAHGGVLGKHAGDGASALFVADRVGESAAARAALEAARSIREAVPELGGQQLELHVKAGLHWGGKLMVGQVATHGRLEVTALGDEMNEGARIESVAPAGKILASKDLIERLDDEDADGLGLDPATITYRTVAELGGVGKVERDAGSVAVAEI